MEAVDFAAVQGIVLWGQRQGLMLLEKGYKQLHKEHTLTIYIFIYIIFLYTLFYIHYSFYVSAHDESKYIYSFMDNIMINELIQI